MLDAGRLRKGRNRVLRGGSWINDRRNLRSANRNANSPDNRNDNIGLRLAGASWAGGSINQRSVPFRLGGQNQGPRRGSRLLAEPLPVGRSNFDCSGGFSVVFILGVTGDVA